MPSPRDIPRVKQAWSKLNYDKLIVKYKPQWEAYAEAREFFLNHKEYTHLVICADDLVIELDDLDILLEWAELYNVMDGVCGIDESQPNTLAIQPIGCNLSGNQPDLQKGAWIERKDTESNYQQVGHSGAACRVIDRETFELITFTGGNPNRDGWFDFGMTKELTKLGIPIMVNTSVYMDHLRTAQKPVNEYGYTLWIQR